MPPRTRGTKGPKPLKENLVTVHKTKTKSVGKITKPARKALADKTNSASDDNTSTEKKKKTKQNHEAITGLENMPRPRREKRIPTRFIGNIVLKKLSNSKVQSGDETIVSEPTTHHSSVKVISPAKVNTTIESPFKTPKQSLENSLVGNRPKRICRLPSKFEDHSISPSKYIPIIPCHASTPIVKNKSTKVSENPAKCKENQIELSQNKITESNHEGTVLEDSTVRGKVSKSKQPDIKLTTNEIIFEKRTRKKRPVAVSDTILENINSKVTENFAKSKEKQIELAANKITFEKRVRQKRHIENSPEVNSDSNNNAKRRLVRQKNTDQDKVSPKDKIKTIKKPSKKINNKSFSFRVLEDKKNSSNVEDNPDVYEFTYDPSEEPPPVKKTRKKAVKKPAKPKTVVFKYYYDQNVSKALAALKNVIAKKPDAKNVVAKKPNVPKVVITPAVENVNTEVAQIENSVTEQNIEHTLQQKNTQVSVEESAKNNPGDAPKLANVTNPKEKLNDNPVRVEDIAADFEMSMEDYNDINYSPVNSPQHPKSPVDNHQTLERSVYNKDPLNLREGVSFFDDNPVASSSMNISTRHPQASPWRVEFGSLPIKWQVNSYVKPNMTPAVESSFINFEDNKKKHVYTNMIGNDDSAAENVQNQPNLKQTSIISFIREVVQKSAQKNKRARSVTPSKANIFDDLSKAYNVSDKTPKKSDKSVDRNGKNVEENASGNSEHTVQDKENSNDNNQKKSKKTEKDNDGTFFGFDESEDVENVSLVKVNPKVRALRPRARAVLQEINAMTGPMRALPLAAKSKIAASSDAVNKMYEEIKSAADAPVFPEKNSMQKNSEVTTVDEVSCNMDEDSDSVHLFEDIELIHHLKPTRKSYGKAKKVTFRQHSSSTETQDMDYEKNVSDEEDDLADLTFTMPSFQPEKKVKKKKKAKKQKMSKKEQKALDEWAAGFNSMCEDIEEVPLIVE